MEKIDYKILVLNDTDFILSPEKFSNRYGQSFNFWKEIFLDLVKEQRLIPVYKLKTNKLIENFDNDWSYSRATFCKIFKAKDGELIDGSELRNLEIKFKKNNSFL
jgi:hypothetical protein